MLDRHQDAVEALLKNDCLAVFARGFGLEAVLSELVRCKSSPTNVVFFLNIGESLQNGINGCLALSNHPPLLPITSEFTGADRQKLVAQGGCFVVTSRILIVDLLTGNIAPELLTGLVVNRAHHVSDGSLEAFIVRVLTRINPNAWIKALSDRPEQLSVQHRMQQVVTLLRVRCVTLWPYDEHARASLLLQRYDSPQVSDNGTRTYKTLLPTPRVLRAPDVVQMDQQLSDLQRQLRALLSICAAQCVCRIQSDHKLPLIVDSIRAIAFRTACTDEQVFQVLSADWEGQIRQHLPQENFTPKTRQLIDDFRWLCQMAAAVEDDDPFHLYRQLTWTRQLWLESSQQYQNRDASSLWWMSEAGDAIVPTARQRLYRWVSPVHQRAMFRIFDDTGLLGESFLFGRGV